MNTKIKVRQYYFASHHYAVALELRDRVLRKPLGLRLSDADTENEFNQVHFGAFYDKMLVGCLILAPAVDRATKMRQVAVDPRHSRQGIGRELVAAAEKYARSKGYEKIILHARLSAVSFYLSLGYSEFGDEFIEVGIPHKKMQKSI